jgi:predicted ATPase
LITRAHIKGYKTLRDVEVEFKPLTVVLGPNSAGKSNLHDALALLGRMGTAQNLNAAFEAHRGSPLEAFSFGDAGLADVLARESARFSIEADIQLSDSVVRSVEDQIRRAREGLPEAGAREPRPFVTERRLRYGVTVEIRTSSGHLRVVDEYLLALRADGEPRGSRRPFLERTSGRIHLRMEKQAHPVYEEVGQDRTIVSKGLYAPHYPHITALREELARWRFYYLEPTAMRDEIPLREVSSLNARGTNIAAFFNSLKASKGGQFDAIAKALHQVIPSLDGIDVERTVEGFVRLMVSEQGMPLSARIASEGTLRVLALLAIANPLEAVSVVGYEEPENGVHPRRLAVVADLLRNATRRGDTQFLINTHSPVLPEFFEADPRSVLLRCYRDGRATQFEPFRTSGPLFGDQEISDALDEDVETPLRDRFVRGDFGG